MRRATSNAGAEMSIAVNFAGNLLLIPSFGIAAAAWLTVASEGIVVAGVLPGGPAARAGLQKGDLVERIDGAGTEGLGLTECMQRLRGPEGSRVSVTVTRAFTALVSFSP